MDEKRYVPPTIEDLGSVHDLTLAVNKKHSATDQYTAATGGAVIGSIYPVN